MPLYGVPSWRSGRVIRPAACSAFQGLSHGRCPFSKLGNNLRRDAGVNIGAGGGRAHGLGFLVFEIGQRPLRKKAALFGARGRSPNCTGRISQGRPAAEGTALHVAQRRKSGRQPREVAWPRALTDSGCPPKTKESLQANSGQRPQHQWAKGAVTAKRDQSAAPPESTRSATGEVHLQSIKIARQSTTTSCVIDGSVMRSKCGLFVSVNAQKAWEVLDEPETA